MTLTLQACQELTVQFARRRQVGDGKELAHISVNGLRGGLKLYPNPTPAALRQGTQKRLRPVVLIVDDDFDARAVYRKYLVDRGCVVYTARNGLVGVARAKSRRPNVIIMDLAMPRLDGFGATARLKSAPETKDIPVIALSAVPISRNAARAAGCDAFLSKPCLPDLLWCEIQLFLDTGSSRH